MTATTTTHSPDVPVPAGVIEVDSWQDDIPQRYRVLLGHLRRIDGVDIDRVSVHGSSSLPVLVVHLRLRRPP
jgi:hypothetical protein